MEEVIRLVGQAFLALLFPAKWREPPRELLEEALLKLERLGYDVTPWLPHEEEEDE